MGNRAVITHNRGLGAPCIYLHWNGGRASVEGFLAAARDLGIRHINEDNQVAVMDAIADMIARAFFGNKVGINVYRQIYGDSDRFNGDNGVFVVSKDLEIIDRRCLPDRWSAGILHFEEINTAKTNEIRELIVSRAAIYND